MHGGSGQFVTNNTIRLNGSITRESLRDFEALIMQASRQPPRFSTIFPQLLRVEGESDRVYIVDPSRMQVQTLAVPPGVEPELHYMIYEGESGMWFDGQNPRGIPPPSNSQEAKYGPPPGGA